MKLLTFKHQGEGRLGWLLEDQQTVLAVDPNDSNMPQSIMDIIKRGPYAREQLTSARKSLENLKLDDLQLLEPIVPSAIFCVGVNYTDHAKEMGRKLTEHPTLFWRLARNHVPHGEPLWAPTLSQTLDWEAELAVIIGKGGRYIAAEHAREHIFGYSIYNEGSVREYQKHTVQYGLGKAFHASAAFGPWIVTADEFGDPYEHQIESWVSGEKMQDASISLMLHRIEDTIEYISSATELKPGDIISTGTPSGNGAGRNPQRFLQDGDTVKITISGIGTLSNPVEAEPTDLNAVACSC
ncbi:MAG: fumarylacetoacetate hydrolase family protein [Proteobacteria bacterium]|nr:fumarylacetoacetate hydrolase family protein [Pseudomonadota bacterium]